MKVTIAVENSEREQTRGIYHIRSAPLTGPRRLCRAGARDVLLLLPRASERQTTFTFEGYQEVPRERERGSLCPADPIFQGTSLKSPVPYVKCAYTPFRVVYDRRTFLR